MRFVCAEFHIGWNFVLQHSQTNIRLTNCMQNPTCRKPSGRADLQTWVLQISNFITGGNSKSAFRENILKHFGGPQQAWAALYFASLNQAWPCQSRPIRVTIAPAVEVDRITLQKFQGNKNILDGYLPRLFKI
jgi:hypothetical protein